METLKLNNANLVELTNDESVNIDGGGFGLCLLGGIIGGLIVDFITNDRGSAFMDGWNSVG